jgi:hypothetical protein
VQEILSFLFSLTVGSHAPVGQTLRQLPQPMQRLSKMMISGWPDKLSGLWHHQQHRGQPFRNTVVRIPGPSWIEYFWILATNPLSISVLPQSTPSFATNFHEFALIHYLPWPPAGEPFYLCPFVLIRG